MKELLFIYKGLKNKNINLLNLHAGICRFSNNIYDVFGAVYLIGLGISFKFVALAWIASLILRFLLRPLSFKLSQKIGLKKALILGVVINSLLFIVLAKINGLNNWFYFFIFYVAICDIAYWLPYHSYYAALGDNNCRGKQIGIELGLVTILTAIAPIVGGLIITHFGFWSLYFTAFIVMILSSIPLLFAKNVKPIKSVNLKKEIKKITKKGMLMMIGDGILYSHNFIWTIVLFYLVGEYITFGWLITLQLLITIISFWILGCFIDDGDGKRIAFIGLASLAVLIILRAFLIKTIPEIIIANILVALSMTFYSSSFNVGLYNQAKKSRNTLLFHFLGECGWDIGATISLSLSVILFSLGIPLRYIIVVSLPGLFITYKILRKFYSERN